MDWNAFYHTSTLFTRVCISIDMTMFKAQMEIWEHNESIHEVKQLSWNWSPAHQFRSQNKGFSKNVRACENILIKTLFRMRNNGWENRYSYVTAKFIADVLLKTIQCSST